MHVSFKQTAPPCATPRHYKRALTEDIFQTALNKRFFRISRQQDPPFYAAEVPCGPLPARGVFSQDSVWCQCLHNHPHWSLNAQRPKSGTVIV